MFINEYARYKLAKILEGHKNGVFLWNVEEHTFIKIPL